MLLSFNDAHVEIIAEYRKIYQMLYQAYGKYMKVISFVFNEFNFYILFMNQIYEYGFL